MTHQETLPEEQHEQVVCPNCGSDTVRGVRQSEVKRARRIRKQQEEEKQREERSDLQKRLHGCALFVIVFFTFGLALLIPMLIAVSVNTYHRVKKLLFGPPPDPIVIYICQSCDHRWVVEQYASDSLKASSETQ
jgi:DNA-directed RNA polymerase subunit RPC12/RpoP